MIRLLALATPVLAAATVLAADPQVLHLKTLQAQMRYDQTDLVVPPGADVKIIFENTDDMPHNFCLFKEGTDVVEVCNKQMEKPEEALKRNWLPEDPRMFAHSKLLNPKEKDEITFKAPDKAGSYPFVCSFPGHAATMRGNLRIYAPGPKLSNLHFAMYLGDWKKLPNFATLKPFREGELPDGLVELKLDDYRNQFGVVYTGKLKAPKDGDYTFSIAGDDGVRLSVDGKQVTEADGIHPSSEIHEGKTKLKAGDHDFKLEYFQGAGEAEVYCAWSGGDFGLTPLSKWVHPSAKTGAAPKVKKDTGTGMPLVVTDEPVIYRNYISGAGMRSLGVGYPGGFNLAYNAENMNLVYLWHGAFIDAARHWTDRGGGSQPPLGFDVLRIYADLAPALAVLKSPTDEWPKSKQGERPEGLQWKGFVLDAKRIPTFHYTWNGVDVTERFDTEGSSMGADGKMVRTLTLSGPIPPGGTFLVASGAKIDPASNSFNVDGGKFGINGVNYDNHFQVAVDGAAIAGGNRLLVPARPQIKITYTWPNTHAGHH